MSEYRTGDPICTCDEFDTGGTSHCAVHGTLASKGLSGDGGAREREAEHRALSGVDPVELTTEQWIHEALFWGQLLPAQDEPPWGSNKPQHADWDLVRKYLLKAAESIAPTSPPSEGEVSGGREAFNRIVSFVADRVTSDERAQFGVDMDKVWAAMSPEAPMGEPMGEPGEEIESLRAAKDGAYSERNQLVVAYAKLAKAQGWTVGLGYHTDPNWEDDWRNIVYIDTPQGQISWHFHDSEKPLFEWLQLYDGDWDGHTTDEKYERLAALAPKVEPGDWEEPITLTPETLPPNKWDKAEPEEPVAWASRFGHQSRQVDFNRPNDSRECHEMTPLFTHPPAEPGAAREALEEALAKKHALMEETYADDVEQIMDASLILQDAITAAIAALTSPSPPEAGEAGETDEDFNRYREDFPFVCEAWEHLRGYVNYRAYGEDKDREERGLEWNTAAWRLNKLGQRIRGLMDRQLGKPGPLAPPEDAHKAGGERVAMSRRSPDPCIAPGCSNKAAWGHAHCGLDNCGTLSEPLPSGGETLKGKLHK